VTCTIASPRRETLTVVTNLAAAMATAPDRVEPRALATDLGLAPGTLGESRVSLRGSNTPGNFDEPLPS
jgi:hypothetical protein